MGLFPLSKFLDYLFIYFAECPLLSLTLNIKGTGTMDVEQ
jgi:hypothetical protein